MNIHMSRGVVFGKFFQIKILFYFAKILFSIAKIILAFRQYGSGGAKQKSHKKTMIFDFETLLLCLNFDSRDN